MPNRWYYNIKKRLPVGIKKPLGKIRNVLSYGTSLIGNLTGGLEKERLAIVWIDGGFASQVFRYATGQILAEKGFKIKYNISFFDHVDYPLFLEKCFPSISLPVASGALLRRYRILYDAYYHGYHKTYYKRIEDLKRPFYIHSYEMDWLAVDAPLKKYVPWSDLRAQLSDRGWRLLREIEGDDNAVGIHVRRGDMSAYKKDAYWKVLTPAYFEAAVQELIKRVDKPRFYIFSDGVDFCREKLLPLLPDHEAMIVSDNGLEIYEELYLLSRCRNIVASQGSWGQFAFHFVEGHGRFVRYTENMERDMAVDRSRYGEDAEIILIPLSKEMYEASEFSDTPYAFAGY